jgi:hypothetical protein
VKRDGNRRPTLKRVKSALEFYGRAKWESNSRESNALPSMADTCSSKAGSAAGSAAPVCTIPPLAHHKGSEVSMDRSNVTKLRAIFDEMLERDPEALDRGLWPRYPAIREGEEVWVLRGHLTLTERAEISAALRADV